MFKKYWLGLIPADKSWIIYRNYNLLFCFGYIAAVLTFVYFFPQWGDATIPLSIVWMIFTTIPMNLYLTFGIWRSLHYTEDLPPMQIYTYEKRVTGWSTFLMLFGVGTILNYLLG